MVARARRHESEMTAYYGRVSHNGQDLRSQLPELEAHAKAQVGPVRWYRDSFTGTTMERPGSHLSLRPPNTSSGSWAKGG